MWVLLPNKSEDAYQLLLDIVLRKVNRDGRDDFKPTTISVDFENTVIKVLKARFPSSQISGCTFHMRQAIWMKLQEIDLILFCHRDTNFQELVYVVYALSFFPMDKIADYYEQVILQRIKDKTCLEDREDGMLWRTRMWRMTLAGDIGRSSGMPSSPTWTTPG